MTKYNEAQHHFEIHSESLYCGNMAEMCTPHYDASTLQIPF